MRRNWLKCWQSETKICGCDNSTVSAWRAVGFRGFHSQTEVVSSSDMQIHVLPALQDNYMYLVSLVIVHQSGLDCSVERPRDHIMH
jgi:hypothetical protein